MLGHKNLRINIEESETIAIQALGFLASEADRLGRFLAVTGLGPENLRAAATEPGFFAQVLSYIAQDESMLLAFAANSGITPEAVSAAHLALAGPHHEREDA
jgi:Protein of unknown function (DUF3572)